MSPLAVLILAAGGSTRFGSQKLLAQYLGQTLLQTTIAQARPIAGDNLYVVLGSHRQEIIPSITGAKVIEHSQWQEGIGSSIACGVRYLARDYQNILILLADQPCIKTCHLQSLINHSNSRHIVCAVYEQQRGVPAIFPQIYFKDLMDLDGDSGAKKILQGAGEQVIELPLPAAAHDVDKAEDVERLEKRERIDRACSVGHVKCRPLIEV